MDYYVASTVCANPFTLSISVDIYCFSFHRVTHWLLKVNMEQHSWSLVDTGLQRRWWSFLLQVCIPVGCVPPACCPYLPAYTAHRVSAPGGGGVCSRGWGVCSRGDVCSRGRVCSWGVCSQGVSAPVGCIRACTEAGTIPPPCEQNVTVG